MSLHARVGDDRLDDALAPPRRRPLPRGRPADDHDTTTGVAGALPNWKAEEALTILLEALTNRRKHAPRSTATVSFAWSVDAVVVTVQDDGPGFEPTAGAEGRLGQHTMRERAGVLGARLDVQSAPGAGTTVRLTLPRGSA